ncbi:tautomerase family protein [Pseudomonas sp. MWU13-2105]|uniref:tautomerase family protein n=1 Tax=Pseudomonas sp. MWU13-2105 TaxID=2935074 RepID=UPI00200C8148|nr:4-oxalocrotonate tautomerase family protein [Pseudomonas sp. MWU13-2105]
MPVVRVTWFDDKDQDAKKHVAAEITQTLVKHTGVDPKWVYVLFEDVPASNWAVAGELFESEK